MSALKWQLPFSSKFNIGSSKDPTYHWYPERYQARERIASKVKNGSDFLLSPCGPSLDTLVCSLCSKQPDVVNGAFPSLPLSFGTRSSHWSGGSLNSSQKSSVSPTRSLSILSLKENFPAPYQFDPTGELQRMHGTSSPKAQGTSGFWLAAVLWWSRVEAAAWVIVSGVVGKRPWQDQRGKMLWMGCLLSTVHRKGQTKMWEGWQKEASEPWRFSFRLQWKP